MMCRTIRGLIEEKINLDLRSTSHLAPCQSKVEILKGSAGVGWRDDGIKTVGSVLGLKNFFKVSKLLHSRVGAMQICRCAG